MKVLIKKRVEAMLFRFPKLFRHTPKCRHPQLIVAGFFLLQVLVLQNLLSAQTIPVGTFQDQELRSKQLLGLYDSTVSFSVRSLVTEPEVKMNWKKPFLKILPVTIIQQYNSHHPYGWNDGAMIPAKGYQSLISAGIYGSYGPLAIQVQPEFVFAANNNYQFNNAYGSKTTGSYTKLYPGQSAISLSAGSFSIGYSTQNNWWGPGIRSSLLMSNNAPGFGHFFFKTRKPLRTPIGSFEWQLIGGQLQSDDNLSYENNHLLANTLVSKSRYLSGLVFSYQPKWVPGLFVGFTRSVQTYSAYNEVAELSFFEKYIPVLALAVQKKNNFFDDTLYRDQLASFFLRWALPKANAEFYVEYGFNDYGVNTRDYLLGPSHSAAYIAGFRKIKPLRDKQRLEFGLEITQMSQTPDWMVRNAGNWYVHSQVSEGYTHQNQILGAGAGFGANVQSITTTWVNGWTQLGILIERIDRDPQTHVNKWVDFGVGVLPQWKFNQYLVSGKFELINSKNYIWEKDLNRLNFHTRLSIAYLFR